MARMGDKFRKSPFLLSILLLAATFLIFFLSGYAALELLKLSKERDLGSRMLAIGRTLAMAGLSGQSFFLLERPLTPLSVMDDPLEEIDNIRQLLREVRAENNLRTLMIIDGDAHVLIDSRDEFSTGEEYPLLRFDENEIEMAFSGEPAASPLYRVGGNSHKRVYVPLKNSSGEATAVLRLEASRDYFSELRDMRDAMLWIGFVVFCLLAFMALIFYTMLARLIRMEHSLAFADRLKSMGALAASLAHEVRNPLSIMRATAESVSEELQPNAEQQPLLRSIIEEIDRMNELMSRFLQFASPSIESNPDAAADAETTIASVVSFFQKDMQKQSIQIKGESEKNLPPVAMEEKSLRQILLNLLINAKDAIGEKGVIEVRSRRRKQNILIEILDDGRGIPAENIPRVFDPFFSTREGGTGLGLFVSRMLAERAGGSLEIANREGRGARALLILPIAAPQEKTL